MSPTLRTGSFRLTIVRLMTLGAAVLAGVIAATPASAAVKPPNPKLIRALNALTVATPAIGTWGAVPTISGGGPAVPLWNRLHKINNLLNSQWDDIRSLTSYGYRLASEAANKQDVDSLQANTYAALRKFYGATTVKDCSTKSLASVCLRQSVKDIRDDEGQIASETDQFISVLQGWYDATTQPGFTPENVLSPHGLDYAVFYPKLRKLHNAISAVERLV